MTESTNLLSSLQQTWTSVIDALPDVILAFVLMFVGWALARLVRRLAVRLFRAIRLDEMAEKAGFDDFLVQGGVRYTTVTLLAGAIYWIILLVVFIALLNALGIQAAGELFARMVDYLPNVALAVGILVFGSLVARIAGGVANTYLSNMGSPAAEPIGALARYAVLVFVVFMAAEQLAIRSEVLVSAFQIAFAALCLAAALAFGLGGRDWAARVIDRYTKK
jgi:Mechanosensitive ion channel, conserved TM helix